MNLLPGRRVAPASRRTLTPGAGRAGPTHFPDSPQAAVPGPHGSPLHPHADAARRADDQSARCRRPPASQGLQGHSRSRRGSLHPARRPAVAAEPFFRGEGTDAVVVSTPLRWWSVRLRLCDQLIERRTQLGEFGRGGVHRFVRHQCSGIDHGRGALRTGGGRGVGNDRGTVGRRGGEAVAELSQRGRSGKGKSAGSSSA